jgi:hypothetical protein
MLVTIGLLGMFHITMPVACDYNDHSVFIWPWEQCYPTDGTPVLWTSMGHQESIGVFTSPRQSEVLILLGIVLLALRKLPDRVGTVA